MRLFFVFLIFLNLLFFISLLSISFNKIILLLRFLNVFFNFLIILIDYKKDINLRFFLIYINIDFNFEIN